MDSMNADHADSFSINEILAELYEVQKCTFFLEDMMGQVIDRLGLSNDDAIAAIGILMEKGYLSTKSFLPAVFLNHQYIRCFPAVLSAKAIALLKENNQKQG